MVNPAYLQMPSSIKKQVLGLDVAVSDALTMQICNSTEDLLEAALYFAGGHTSFLDGCVQVATWTVFHDFTPPLLFVLYEVHRFNDIDVVQC